MLAIWMVAVMTGDARAKERDTGPPVTESSKEYMKNFCQILPASPWVVYADAESAGEARVAYEKAAQKKYEDDAKSTAISHQTGQSKEKFQDRHRRSVLQGNKLSVTIGSKTEKFQDRHRRSAAIRC